MDITAYASSVRNQYQSVLQGLKNGTVSYLDALDQHREMFPQTRGLRAGIVKGYGEASRVKTDIPAAVIERMQEVLIKSNHASAVKTYQHAGGEHMEDTRNTFDGIPKAATPERIFGPIRLREFRQPFNTAAFEYLSTYANDNKTEWKTAAKELDISIEGGMYRDHFFRVPAESGADVSVGTPNSEAERIFRHIASAQDIAQFNSRMDPYQEITETRMTNFVTGIMEDVSINMDNFAPHLETLQAAGITINDMARALLTRDEHGTYQAVQDNEKAAEIAQMINTNPGLRALYDTEWNRFASSRESLSKTDSGA